MQTNLPRDIHRYPLERLGGLKVYLWAQQKNTLTIPQLQYPLSPHTNVKGKAGTLEPLFPRQI